MEEALANLGESLFLTLCSDKHSIQFVTVPIFEVKINQVKLETPVSKGQGVS